MATHRAAVATAPGAPFDVQTFSRPTAGPGQAVVRVLAVRVLSWFPHLGKGMPVSFPLTPGTSSIARVEEVGPDSVSLTKGQLVYCDITVRGRDDPAATILMGFFNGGFPAAQKLAEGEWRDSTFREYATFPLENVYPLNEDVLTKNLGYAITDLYLMEIMMVPYGGLQDIGLMAGDTLIVAPATGKFGGAAVAMGLAMGAVVIACGRNQTALNRLTETFGKTGRLRTVRLGGEKEQDMAAIKAAAPNPAKGADAYIDFSPPAATASTHIAAAVGALNKGGRISFMGGPSGDVLLPYLDIMRKELKLKGKFMYQREHITQVVKLVETGVLKLGEDGAGVKTIAFGLEDVQKAVKTSSENDTYAANVVLTPASN